MLALLKLEETAETDADPLGSESVWRDGVCVGSVSSGGYGYATGAYLAWAYLQPAVATPGQTLEVLVLGQTRKAEVLAGPTYDPANALPRADALVTA